MMILIKIDWFQIQICFRILRVELTKQFEIKKNLRTTMLQDRMNNITILDIYHVG